MYLVEILLPLYDNHGKPLSKALFGKVADELTSTFGGLTAHTRAPAQGMWQGDAGDKAPVKDDILIYQVLVDSIDREWWGRYRGSLEERFRQERVLIRAQPVIVL